MPHAGAQTARRRFPIRRATENGLPGDLFLSPGNPSSVAAFNLDRQRQVSLVIEARELLVQGSDQNKVIL